MPVYEIHGVEEEAGVTTSVPIQAPTETEAIEEAHRQGILDARVVGLHENYASQPEHEEVAMPANELVEKSSPIVQPRIAAGWLLLLFALPAYVTMVAWVGPELGLATGVIIAAEIIGVLIIIAIAVVMFQRYWK
jgi:hypothetical protein